MRRMNSVSILALLLSASASLQMSAQVLPAEVQIAGAVSAAPAAERDSATVLGYANYHRLVTLRAGTDAFICLADDPSESGWHVACYHRDLEPFMALGRQLKAEGKTHAEIDSLRLAAIQSGAIKMPDGPRALFQLYGRADSLDAATGVARGAVGMQVVYIPYATEESTGLPTQPGDALPWLMSPGKPWAHIMIMR